MEKEQIICIHCASIVYLKEGRSELVYRVNVEGTRNVIDLCLKKMWKTCICQFDRNGGRASARAAYERTGKI